MLLSFPTTDRKLSLLKFISGYSVERVRRFILRAKTLIRLLSISLFFLEFLSSASSTSRIISRASMCSRHCSNLGVVTSLVCIAVSIQSLLLCKVRTHNSARVHFRTFNGHARLYIRGFPSRGAEINCIIGAVNLSTTVIFYLLLLNVPNEARKVQCGRFSNGY